MTAYLLASTVALVQLYLLAVGIRVWLHAREPSPEQEQEVPDISLDESRPPVESAPRQFVLRIQQDVLYLRNVLVNAKQIHRPQLHRPPGFRLQRFAEFFFLRKTCGNVLEPVIRDLQDEHMEALAEGRTVKARWVRIRGTWSFWAAVVAQTPVSLIKWLFKQLTG